MTVNGYQLVIIFTIIILTATNSMARKVNFRKKKHKKYIDNSLYKYILYICG